MHMLDLFGEIVVTLDDVTQWVVALAPAYMANERSFERHVRLWDVASKVTLIRRAVSTSSGAPNTRYFLCNLRRWGGA
ncbi:hypothetical protein C5O80_12435 [Burkholderia sp. SRS-46]|nr:hypothetical protein C5O80_12435 [Burkholderia sp. SRS-46]